jgi:hypothetical protein
MQLVSAATAMSWFNILWLGRNTEEVIPDIVTCV